MQFKYPREGRSTPSLLKGNPRVGGAEIDSSQSLKPRGYPGEQTAWGVGGHRLSVPVDALEMRAREFILKHAGTGTGATHVKRN